MTQIVTISATTAAYATEGLKPSARISGSPQSDETKMVQLRESRAADNDAHLKSMQLVGPPAIALFFLTAGERNRLLGQTTQREAEEAYLAAAEGAERRDPEADDEAESDEDASDDDEDNLFGQLQQELLALPSPDEFA
jgi:hypothetical protein